MECEIIRPYGYCSGVKNSIKLTEMVLSNLNNQKCYILGPLIHNEITNKELTDKGATILYSIDNDYSKYLDSFDENSVVILSAHGTEKSIIEELDKRKIQYYNAVCPIVNNINKIIASITDKEIIYIGIKSHTEANASISYANSSLYFYDINDQNFDYSQIKTSDPIVINQSTLSNFELEHIYVDIKKHLPHCFFKEVLCPMVVDRQAELISKINDKDCFVIVGSPTSNNTKTLLNIYYKYTKSENCYLVNSLDETKKIDFSKYKKTYISSGTSTPNKVVDEIYAFIKSL